MPINIIINKDRFINFSLQFTRSGFIVHHHPICNYQITIHSVLWYYVITTVRSLPYVLTTSVQCIVQCTVYVCSY